MEIVLIRHGEPEWVRDGLNVVNPPLTDRGHLQAARLAEVLQSETFDEILVSPLTSGSADGRTAARGPWARRGHRPVVGRDSRPDVARDAGREGS